MADGWVLGERYRVLDRVGSGGMAEVFRANDQMLDRLVAVKVFRSAQVAEDAANDDRRRVELQALAKLNHPNLITLYDGNLSATPPYLVMELIDGPSLSERIAEGPLGDAVVRQIGAQLADAMAYVHGQGMVHRDVKPENILLGVDRSDEDSEFRARLSDFGIVRLLGSERLTSANFTLGTASYLAPEQVRGGDVHPRADVYSLALVLIEALTGQRAFTGGAPVEVAMARLSRRPAIPANLPEPWPGLLHQMTELSPTARPSASQVARTLRGRGGADTTTLIPAAVGGAAMLGAAAAAPTVAAAPMPPVAARREVTDYAAVVPERRNGLWITAAVFAVVIIIAGIALAIILSSSGDSGSPGGSTTPTSSGVSTGAPSKSGSSSKRSTRRSSQAPSTQQSTNRSSQSSSERSSSSPSSSTPPQSSTTSQQSTSQQSTSQQSTSQQPTSQQSTSRGSTSPPPTTSTSRTTTSRSQSSASSGAAAPIDAVSSSGTAKASPTP